MKVVCRDIKYFTCGIRARFADWDIAETADFGTQNEVRI